MSLPNPESVVTEQRLNEFYGEILPYLGRTAETGFTPVGTIIAVMGNSAPTNYLACNGQTLNIADYPELAAYFKAQFGSANYFGGDGTTTFKICDLRGEFLRGTGTNSHANQGSGSNVGVHQDATEIPYSWTWNDASKSRLIMELTSTAASATGNAPVNPDQVVNHTVIRKYVSIGDLTVTTNANDGRDKFTAKPTNTSVLYCIATKNIYINPSLDYSTDEKVVGTWIDGKPLYQKIVTISTASNITDTEQAENVVTISNVSIENGWIVGGYIDNGSGQMMSLPSTLYGAFDSIYYISVNLRTNSAPQPNTIQVLCNRSALANKSGYVIIQYTKTTS